MRKGQVDLQNAVVWIPDSKTPTGVAEAPLSSLAVEAFVNVDNIPTHLHASIRLTLRYLLANSLDKLYRLGPLCSMFAGREGFEPVMPACKISGRKVKLLVAWKYRQGINTGYRHC